VRESGTARQRNGTVSFTGSVQQTGAVNFIFSRYRSGYGSEHALSAAPVAYDFNIHINMLWHAAAGSRSNNENDIGQR